MRVRWVEPHRAVHLMTIAGAASCRKRPIRTLVIPNSAMSTPSFQSIHFENEGRLGNGGIKTCDCLYRSDQSSGSALLRHGQAFLSRGERDRSRRSLWRPTHQARRRTRRPSHGRPRKTWPALTLAVSFGRVQKHRETCTVKLFDQHPSMLGRPMRDIIQKLCKPGDESEFKAKDIEFFVVKKGIPPKNKTNS